MTTKNTASGSVNAAPFSWYGAVCADPPLISLSIARRGSELKDTSRNILESGEFVVNASTVPLAGVISRCAGDFEPTVSEIELTGLDLIDSIHIGVPRVAQCPFHLECRLHKHLELGNGPLDFIIGEVVAFHVAKEITDDNGRIDISAWPILSRLNADNYAGLDPEFFSIPRG